MTNEQGQRGPNRPDSSIYGDGVLIDVRYALKQLRDYNDSQHAIDTLERLEYAIESSKPKFSDELLAVLRQVQESDRAVGGFMPARIRVVVDAILLAAITQAEGKAT